MLASSLTDADQVLSFGKPLKGGGPLMASTYRGSGFLVERTGRFEFPALSSTGWFDVCARGDAGLFIFPPFCCEAGPDASVFD